ncbi:MAG: homoserine kinase [Dehalococcoidia bacterium]|nr:homoserine kinase [Dehalococcoidia bacterium]
MPARSVTVRVPATSANLGSGFDSLGVALDWTALIHVTVHDGPVPRPVGPIEAMAVSAAVALYRRAGAQPPSGISASYEGEIPVGRGLGVSAAARVAGVMAANALMAGGYDAETLLGLVAQLEGHADNAAPALLGGLQIVVAHDDGLAHLALEPPGDLRLALLIPDFSMPTEESRQRLPEWLTRNQSVHNIGRAALLVAAIRERRYDLLNIATEDVLHQPARAQIFPPMYAIFQAARGAGAHGVYLSGGGSTIAAFGTTGLEQIAGAMREAAAVQGFGAQTRVCALSARGAELVAG